MRTLASRWSARLCPRFLRSCDDVDMSNVRRRPALQVVSRALCEPWLLGGVRGSVRAFFDRVTTRTCPTDGGACGAEAGTEPLRSRAAHEPPGPALATHHASRGAGWLRAWSLPHRSHPPLHSRTTTTSCPTDGGACGAEVTTERAPPLANHDNIMPNLRRQPQAPRSRRSVPLHLRTGAGSTHGMAVPLRGVAISRDTRRSFP